MENNSQFTSMNNLSSSTLEQTQRSEFFKFVQTKKCKILDQIKNPQSSNSPKILNVVNVISKDLQELLNFNYVKEVEVLAESVFDILQNLLVLVLNTNNFVDYLEFQENILYELNDEFVILIQKIVSKFHSFLSDLIYMSLEKMMIFYLVVIDKSIFAYKCFVLHLWTFETFLESPLLKNLLKICEIHSLPIVRQMLIKIDKKFRLMNKDPKFFSRNIPFESDLHDYKRHKKHKIFEQIQSFLSCKGNYLNRLFLDHHNSYCLFKYLHSGFEKKELLGHLNKSSDALQEMYCILDNFFEDYFDEESQYPRSLSPLIFKQMKIFFYFLSSNEEFCGTDINCDNYFNILDSLITNYNDFDQCLIFLKFVKLSPYIIKEDSLKIEFQQMLEETFQDALKTNDMLNNPIFIFQMLSAYIYLTKVKIITQPSANFKKIIFEKFSDLFAKIIEQNNSSPESSFKYESKTFNRAKVHQAIIDVIKKLNKFFKNDEQETNKSKSKETKLQNQLEKIGSLIKNADSLDKNNLSKDFENLIFALNSKN